ncbi:hypothetical protein GIB67_004625 [Kingdonia uniflora]|uniref:Protein FAR1-RELATED SEQUENCE n=1 Tax=Kingdonia uniflora TaxID=39325 RepID=A0A7J7MD23_9MAGN|nr:hypothetical protein GIB67_004625 [Kingdonia uniflora]
MKKKKSKKTSPPPPPPPSLSLSTTRPPPYPFPFYPPPPPPHWSAFPGGWPIPPPGFTPQLPPPGYPIVSSGPPFPPPQSFGMWPPPMMIGMPPSTSTQVEMAIVPPERNVQEGPPLRKRPVTRRSVKLSDGKVQNSVSSVERKRSRSRRAKSKKCEELVNKVITDHDKVEANVVDEQERYKGKVVRPRRETRVDCRAAMSIKRRSSKWVVDRFHKEHNHGLADPAKAERLRSHRKITSTTKSVIDALYKNCVYSSKKPEEFESDWEAILMKYNLKENSWLNDMYEQRHHWMQSYLKDTFYAGFSTARLNDGMNYFDGFIDDETPLPAFIPQYEQAIKKRREEEGEEDFMTMYTGAGSTSKNLIEEQALRVYTRNISTIFSHEIFESSAFIARKISMEEHLSTAIKFVELGASSIERINAATNIIEDGMKQLSLVNVSTSVVPPENSSCNSVQGEKVNDAISNESSLVKLRDRLASPKGKANIKHVQNKKRKCGKCKKEGHYTNTCPKGSVNEPNCH